MAHFAEIDTDNIVTQVIVVDNSDILNDNGIEDEEVGIKLCSDLFGGIWKQTSYNSNFRKNYAGIGDLYDVSRDAFIAFPIYDGWILNEDTCRYEAPIPYPEDGQDYKWDDEQENWIIV